MADLNKLFGKKPTEQVTAPSSGGLNALKALANKGSAAAASETVDASSDSQVQAAVQAEPQKLAASGGFKLGGFKAPAQTTPAASTTQPSVSDESTGLTLDDLESSVDEGTRPAGILGQSFSSFADEVPASEVYQVVRTLPEDLTPQMAQFVQLMDGVYHVLNDPDLVGSVIKNIMIELKSNPQYIKLVAPDDIRQWIRSMREHMGLARVVKAEKKAKTASRKASKAVDQDMLNDLADLGIVFEEGA